MIWFKNIQLYRIAANHALTAESIAESLAKKPFFPCGSHDLHSQGFIAPAPHQPDLITYVHQDAVLICLKVEEKIIPSVVVKQEAEARISRIESEEDEARKVGRKEAKCIRERVAEELRPRAFTRVSTHRALIDLKLGLILVDSAAAAKAEHLLVSLREAMGSLPTRLIQTHTTPQTAMTRWLENEMPAAFDLDADGELKFPGDDGAVARFLRQDLKSDEVKQHLATGKLVSKMGMAWNERIAFQLTEKLEIKRLNMLDVLQDELKNADIDTQDAMYESSAALFIGEMREFVPSLIGALGGELA
jgi:recombination associated protein RdgC